MNTCTDRRQFVTGALGAAALSALTPTSRLLGRGVSRPGPGPDDDRLKLIIVQFGGGTRNSESIADLEHRFIPRLWGDMVPHGTLFTNMRVEHRVVHPNSTGSMMTGHWEWDDIDWSRPVAHPTVFEVFRKARQAPDTSAWAFVYASILAKTGESRAAGYGAEFAANVVEPPTVPRSTAAEMDRLMHAAAAAGSPQAEQAAARECARLARHTSRINRSGLRSHAARRFMDEQYGLWRAGSGSTSHDAFLTDRAIACMRTFSPDVMAVDYGEIDCAHYGSWSRYVEAITRTDQLTWRLWRAVQGLPAYRDKTLLLVLPDHGRQLDDGDGWGFVHHSDFYTGKGVDEGCRRVWMLALGPGIEPGRTVTTPTPITTVAATGLQFLGLDASRGAADSAWPALRG